MTTLFVGLGNMGTPMVRRLAAHTDLVLHDADASRAEGLAEELGASTLASLGGDLSAVDSVVLMLPSSRVVESVLLDTEAGLLRSLRHGALVVDMGSSEPASSRRLAREARELGVDFVDAPVSGGVSKAETGELAIMAGGEPAAVDRARPLLETMGGPVVHVGASGAGHAVKALNNLLSAANVAAAAEVLAVGARFGVDPEAMIGVINSATGRSQATEVKFPRHILPGTWDSGFAMDLMLKDLAIARALADDVGVTLEVTGAAHDLARRARAALGEGRDHTEVARYVQEQADASTDQARPQPGEPGPPQEERR